LRELGEVHLRINDVVAVCQTGDQTSDAAIGAAGKGTGHVLRADTHHQTGASLGACGRDDLHQHIAAADQVGAVRQGADLQIVQLGVAATGDQGCQGG